MTCNAMYDEAMSLKLDGLLDAERERELDRHIGSCGECGPLWTALKRADAMLWVSVAEPVPAPVGFHAKVMERITAGPVVRPQPVAAPPLAAAVAVPPADPVPLSAAVPPLTRPLGSLTGVLAGYGNDAPSQLTTYLRGVAGVALTVIGTVGLLLTLIVSGTITLGGPFEGAGEIIRTWFVAVETWVRSLAVGFGLETLGAAGLVLALLLLIGWQVVANYYRFATAQRGKTAYLEALSS